VLPPLRHEATMWGAAFSDDESRILTWSEDGTARRWDAATGQEVLPPLRHEAGMGRRLQCR
jgi:WD40 repeat protein